MKVVWTKRAVEDLTAIRAYIARDSDSYAALTAAKILQAVDLLVADPGLGRPGRIPGTRELVIPSTPYLLPYRIVGDRIDLLAVLHGRQRWPARL